MVRYHGESFIKRLCFSIQMCKWLNVQQLTTKTQWDVTILWSPNVDLCRFSNVDWDKGNFTLGVQGNGVCKPTILRTLRKLIV